MWSPDGRTLAVELLTITDYRDVPRLGFVDVRSGEGRRVDDLVLYDGLSKEWSPDSSTLLISPVLRDDPQQQLLVDAVHACGHDAAVEYGQLSELATPSLTVRGKG